MRKQYFFSLIAEDNTLGHLLLRNHGFEYSTGGSTTGPNAFKMALIIFKYLNDLS